MWNNSKEFSSQGKLKWQLQLGLNDFWAILSKALSPFPSPPFQNPDMDIKLTEVHRIQDHTHAESKQTQKIILRVEIPTYKISLQVLAPEKLIL